MQGWRKLEVQQLSRRVASHRLGLKAPSAKTRKEIRNPESTDNNL